MRKLETRASWRLRCLFIASVGRTFHALVSGSVLGVGFGLRVLGRERRRRSDIALADGYIGSFEAKCLYNHWCLVTAQFHAPPRQERRVARASYAVSRQLTKTDTSRENSLMLRAVTIQPRAPVVGDDRVNEMPSPAE